MDHKKELAGLVAFLNLICILAPAAAATNDPPPSGGWVVGDWTVTDARSYSGVNINLYRGNITIKAGGSLTLDHVNLQMYLEANLQLFIEVQPGGTLVMKNGCNLASNSASLHYYFRVRPGAIVTLANSTFRNMGNQNSNSVAENNGLYIASGNVTVDSCTFSDSTYGLFLDRVSPPVTNCAFRNMANSGVCAFGSRSLLRGNGFSGNYYGVSVNFFGAPEVRDCRFTDNSGAAALYTDFSGGRFHHNTISNAASGLGVYCYDSATPSIENCTINTTNSIGVLADARSGPTIQHCNVSSAGYVALYSTDYSSVEAARCNLTSPGYIGAAATYYGSLKLSNCTVRDVYYYGLYLEHYSSVTARDTDIEGRTYGVYCSASSIDFQRVDVASTAYIGMVLYGASDASLTRSSVTSADAGIYLSGDRRGAMSLKDSSVSARNGVGMSVNAASVDMSNSTIYSGNSNGLYSWSFGAVTARNSTITSGSSNPVVYLDRGGNSTCNFTNTYFDQYKVAFTEPTSTVNVFWYLNIAVQWQSFAPVANATVNVTDVLGNRVMEGITNAKGELYWNPIQEYSRTQTSWVNYTSHDVWAYKNGVKRMERRGIRANTKVTVMLSDPDPPLINMTYPPNGLISSTGRFLACGTAEDYVSGLARVDYRIDSGDWAPVEGLDEWSFGVNLSDGQHMLRARAVDYANSVRETAASVMVDTAIALEVDYPAEGTWLNRSSFNLTGVADPFCNITADGNGAPVDADGMFVIPMALEDGPHAINITAVDAAGNTVTIIRNITVDTQPPSLEIFSPENGSATALPYTIFKGKTEPGAQLLIKGEPRVADDNGSFSVIVPLVEGNNTVTVRAEDRAGNANASVVAVRSDTIPPRLKVGSPADGSLTSRPELVVSGETNGTSVLVNGSRAELDGGRFSAGLRLAEGENAIEVKALDEAGNANSTIVHVTLDTRPPFLQIASPPAGHITNLASATVLGLTEMGAAITVNGLVAVNNNGTFSLAVRLLPGDNVISIRAVDAAGNAAVVNRTAVLDQTPPALTITEPASGSRVSQEKVMVRGNTDPGSTVTVNGVRAQLDDKGRFACEIGLSEGENSLVVTAVDAAGNPTTKISSVTRTGPLSISNDESPVMLLGMAIGIAIGAATGLYIGMRRRRREAIHVAPEEPVPGRYDVPDEPVVPAGGRAYRPPAGTEEGMPAFRSSPLPPAPPAALPPQPLLPSVPEAEVVPVTHVRTIPSVPEQPEEDVEPWHEEPPKKPEPVRERRGGRGGSDQLDHSLDDILKRLKT